MYIWQLWDDFNFQLGELSCSAYFGGRTAIIRCIQKSFLRVELYYTINQVLFDALSIFTFLASNPVNTLSFKLHIYSGFYELGVVLLAKAGRFSIVMCESFGIKRIRLQISVISWVILVQSLKSLGLRFPLHAKEIIITNSEMVMKLNIIINVQCLKQILD